MAKRPAPADAVNAFITGEQRQTEQNPLPAEAPAPLPAWLDPDALRHVGGLLRALRRQHDEAQANDPLAIGHAALMRRAAVAELAERIEREGFDAVVNPPAPAPVPDTFAGLSFAAWLSAVAHRGLTDGDALLLACHIWAQMPHPGQGGREVAFLDLLAGIDPHQDPAADAAELYRLLAQPTPKRGRGRPKGRHPQAAEHDLVAARELFARRQAEGRLTVPRCDPWQVLQDLGDVIDQIIASDGGITNSGHLRGDDGPRSCQIQAWFGSSGRRLPSLRRRLVIEAVAKHCLNWWLDTYQAEAGPFKS